MLDDSDVRSIEVKLYLNALDIVFRGKRGILLADAVVSGNFAEIYLRDIIEIIRGLEPALTKKTILQTVEMKQSGWEEWKIPEFLDRFEWDGVLTKLTKRPGRPRLCKTVRCCHV